MPTLGALAKAVRQLVEAARTVARPLAYDAMPGSPARAEWDARPDLATPPLCLPDAYRHGVMLLVSAEDHALGLAELIRAQRTFACYAVARALAETSARAYDLLHPDLSAEERLRRLWNEALWGLYEYAGLANGGPAEGNAEVPQYGRFISQLEGIGVAITRPRRGAPYVGTRRPGVGALLDRMIARETARLNEDVVAPGRTFHSLSSAVSHGAGHSFVWLLEFDSEETGGAVARIARPADPSPASKADDLFVAPLAFAAAVRLASRQMGWNTAPIDAAARRFLKVWIAAASA